MKRRERGTSAMILGLCASAMTCVAQTAAPAPAAATPPTAVALEESFDTTDNVQVYRGYHSAQQKIAPAADDKHEGQAAVKLTWTSSAEGYGSAGVRKTFAAPVDLTGKTLSVWVKTLTPGLQANASIALYDANKGRIGVWYFQVHVFQKGWTQLTFKADEKGGDLTKVSRIDFTGATRAANQTCEMLWDDFREVK